MFAVGLTVNATPAVPAGFQVGGIDLVGQQAASGVLQSNANNTFGGGTTRQGQRFFLHGLGIHVHSRTAATQVDAQEMKNICSSISLELTLGEQRQFIGNVLNWPAGVGAYNGGVNNGEPGLNHMQFFSQGPVFVNELTAFSLRFTMERDVDCTTLANGDLVELIAVFPATTDVALNKRIGA